MIFVPFIYFSILGLFLYRQRKVVDIAIFICFLFAASGIFSILTDIYGVRSDETVNYDITPFAAFTYCGLITLCTLPFLTYSNILIKSIQPVRNELLLKILAWIYFAWFTLVVILSSQSFYGIINGDLGALRTAIYNDEMEDSYLVALPGPIRLTIVVLNMVFGCHWIPIFFAFFCLTVQKLPVKYFFLFIYASLSGPWGSVLGVDRSGFAYYILSFIGIFILFKPFMTLKQKRNISIVSIVFVSIAIIYLTMVTLSRFGGVTDDDSEVAQLSLINYLGQNYINFCFFFDTFDSEWKTVNLLFPFTKKFIFGDEMVGGTLVQQFIEDKTGVSTGVFYTYIGHILITAGHLVATAFCFIYTFFTYWLIYKVRDKTVSIFILFNYIFMSSFIFLGLYTYYYATPVKTFSVFFFYVLIKYLNVNFVFCRKNE